MTAVRTALTISLTALLLAMPTIVAAADIDQLLAKALRAHNVRHLPTKPFEATSKYLLGQALFFDPILSGNRDVACATCHLLRRGTSDALPQSIGVHGTGLGERRQLMVGQIEHPRNSLDLWNRDNNAVTSLFWDGRVEAVEYKGRRFRTPLGEHLPDGLDNALAAQALFPLVRADEMLGRDGERSAATLPDGHADVSNELASDTAALSGEQRSLAVYELILERLIGRKGDEPTLTQTRYRDLFRAASPDKAVSQITIADVANAIAHFEEIAFATRDAPWDRYVAGKSDAISDNAKRGALIFYGKGKCAACHGGPMFSDFSFHSLLVPDAGPGVDGRGEDLGRFYVTGWAEDKYKFRTPPLRNVTLTPPYFHNGSVETLAAAIRHHLDPLALADQYEETGAFAYSVDQIEAVSPILVSGTPLTDEEVDRLIEFLKTLEDSQLDAIERIIPSSVPSGLPVSALSAQAG